MAARLRVERNTLAAGCAECGGTDKQVTGLEDSQVQLDGSVDGFR